MKNYYIYMARPVENGVDNKPTLGSECIFICDGNGKTSNDYTTRFMPQDAPHKDYQLSKSGVRLPASLEKLLDELYSTESIKEETQEGLMGGFVRSDYVELIDLYGRRHRWAEILTPYVLTSVRHISFPDVDLICDRLSKENLKAKSVRAGIAARYQPRLDVLERDYNLKKRELEAEYHKELERVPPATSLLEIVEEF